LEAGTGTATAGFLPMKPGGAMGAVGAICTERSLLRNGEGERRPGGFRPPPVMPGLELGVQAAPSVIIRGRRPWMHGSSPCMTKLKAQR
jgi:hypothetical protein